MNQTSVPQKSVRFENLSFKQKCQIWSVNALRLISDSASLDADKEAQVSDLLENRIDYYMVNNINSDLTEAEKLKWLGVTVVSREHVTYDILNQLLKPANITKAVYRENRPSKNMAFKVEPRQGEVDSRPQIRIIYDTQEQMEIATKLLNIITRGKDNPGYSIVPIIGNNLSKITGNKLDSDKWVVECGFDFSTALKIGRIMRHLFEYDYPAHKIPDTEKKNKLASVQSEMDMRLSPENKGWKASEGVGILLSLILCPWVGMYGLQRDKNGNHIKNIFGNAKANKNDKAEMDLIPKPAEMQLTADIPEMISRGSNKQLSPRINKTELFLERFVGKNVIRYYKKITHKSPEELGKDAVEALFTEDSARDKSIFGTLLANARLPFILYSGYGLYARQWFVGIPCAAVTISFAATAIGNLCYGRFKAKDGHDFVNRIKESVEKSTGYSWTKSPFEEVSKANNVEPPEPLAPEAANESEVGIANPVWVGRVNMRRVAKTQPRSGPD